MSRTFGRHRKSSWLASASQYPAHPAVSAARTRHRHRRPSPVAAAVQRAPGQLTVAVAGSALALSTVGSASTVALGSGAHGAGQSAGVPAALTNSGAPAVPADQPGGGGLDTLTARGLAPEFVAVWMNDVAVARQRAIAVAARAAAARALAAREAKAIAARQAAERAAAARAALARRAAERRRERAARKAAQQGVAATGYADPFRAVSGLIPERIDMGVDFGGAGPVYAIGDGVVTSAMSGVAGWPGGGWITYRLTDGPDAGKVVYLAEDVTPTVTVGEQVTPDTVIANMYDGGDGIETGWATPDGSTALSQLAEAGGISGGGPFPTEVGINFDGLLRFLGAPAASNAGQAGYGTLPAGYPTSW